MRRNQEISVILNGFRNWWFSYGEAVNFHWNSPRQTAEGINECLKHRGLLPNRNLNFTRRVYASFSFNLYLQPLLPGFFFLAWRWLWLSLIRAYLVSFLHIFLYTSCIEIKQNIADSLLYLRWWECTKQKNTKMLGIWLIKPKLHEE